ncbi:hypothetical protein TrRE_jg8116 [Triparma retinervis]|uniref:Uncharacterized protein n=1 Tax=Triparma retinervis TaxID=2557542 RepID=A0A9W7AHP2_9STRA|nr:hypothetical protein TrRE_jg8116 [Triparma retinervis]
MAVNRSAGRVSKVIGEEYVGGQGKGGKRRVAVAVSRKSKFEVVEEMRERFREYVEMDIKEMEVYRERWGLEEIEGEEGRYRSTLPLLPIVGLDLNPTIDFSVAPPQTSGVINGHLIRVLSTSRVDLLSNRGPLGGRSSWAGTVTVLDTLARYGDPRVRLDVAVTYPRGGKVEEYAIRIGVELSFDVPGRYGRVKVEVVKGIAKRILGIVVKEGVKRTGKVVEGDLEVWGRGE